jgi:hypothetical protein
MSRNSPCLAAIAILAFALLPGAASAGTIEGSGTGQLTGSAPSPPLVTITASAEGVSNRLGSFTRTEELILDPVSNTFVGTVTFTAASGETLVGAISGGFVAPGTATGTYQWISGTGRFEHPIGSARFVVTSSDGVHFSLLFKGEITLLKAKP